MRSQDTGPYLNIPEGNKSGYSSTKTFVKDEKKDIGFLLGRNTHEAPSSSGTYKYVYV